MLKKGLYIHIGTNKTGSSSLQTFLYRNRNQLRENGYYYPDMGVILDAHHGISYAIKRPEEHASANVPANWIDVLYDTCPDDCDVILSSEDFHTHKLMGAFEELKKKFEVCVIVYIRDVVSYVASWYAQAVQSRNISIDFDAYSRLYQLDYPGMIERWRQVFGYKGIVVRKFSRSELVGGDIRTDFLDVIGADPYRLDFLSEEKNVSITGNLLHFKRLLNSFITDADSKRIATVYGSLAFTNPRWTGRFHVDAEAVKRIRFQNRKNIGLIESRFQIDIDYHKAEIEGQSLPDMAHYASDAKSIARQIAFQYPDMNDVLRQLAPISTFSQPKAGLSQDRAYRPRIARKHPLFRQKRRSDRH